MWSLSYFRLERRSAAKTVTWRTKIPPANYLEGANSSGGTTNTYETGPAIATFNDQALLITRDVLMPAVEQRVARQALSCIYRFSLQPGADGHFPWPASDLSDPAYPDNDTGPLFGRIPSTLAKTNASLGPPAPSLNWPNDIPEPVAGAKCFDTATWWGSWRDMLFYAVADAYKPGRVAVPLPHVRARPHALP